MTIRCFGPDAPHPGMERVVVWAFICKRCERAWLPRVEENPPRVCPKCKSPYWDRPRRTRQATVAP